MFEGLRDRRPTRDQEAQDAAIAAATSKLARRRMQQAETTGGTAEAGPITHTATVANQLGIVTRHASTVYGPVKADGNYAGGQENVEDQSEVEANQTLTVGAGIHLKGEITNCQTLIVEGQVEGSAKSSALQIADGGAFAGEADIDTAVVSGRFEGTLTATQRLVIRASGRVSGDIRYAAIAIEAGGQISGNIQVIEGKAHPETAAAEEHPQGGQDSQVEIAS